MSATGQRLTTTASHIVDLRVAETVGEAGLVQLPPSLAANGRGHAMLVFLTSGALQVGQGACSVALSAGHWLLLDTTHASSLRSQAPFRLLSLELPWPELRINGALDTDLFCLKPNDTGAGCGTILLGALEASYRHVSPRIAPALRDTVSGLSRMLLGECAPRMRPSMRQVMRTRIEHYIDSHLSDASLCIEQISRSLGCTKRYLHKIFSDSESLNTYIRTRRLNQARADLGNPMLLDRTITDIAMGWGFSNPAHFSRVFKQHFGTSPRSFRNRACAAARSPAPPRKRGRGRPPADAYRLPLQ